jgi:hypothetical protein
VLTLAVAFLLLAIVASILGFVGGGTLGYGAAIVFFAAFLWAVAAHKAE